MNLTHEKINQALPPPGMKYMKYCEGGFSDHLVESSDASCLADYPGHFATGVFLIYLLPLLVFLAVAWYYLKGRKRSPKN